MFILFTAVLLLSFNGLILHRTYTGLDASVRGLEDAPPIERLTLIAAAGSIGTALSLPPHLTESPAHLPPSFFLGIGLTLLAAVGWAVRVWQCRS